MWEPVILFNPFATVQVNVIGSGHGRDDEEGGGGEEESAGGGVEVLLLGKRTAGEGEGDEAACLVRGMANYVR